MRHFKSMLLASHQRGCHHAYGSHFCTDCQQQRHRAELFSSSAVLLRSHQDTGHVERPGLLFLLPGYSYKDTVHLHSYVSSSAVQHDDNKLLFSLRAEEEAWKMPLITHKGYSEEVWQGAGQGASLKDVLVKLCLLRGQEKYLLAMVPPMPRLCFSWIDLQLIANETGHSNRLSGSPSVTGSSLPLSPFTCVSPNRKITFNSAQNCQHPFLNCKEPCKK